MYLLLILEVHILHLFLSNLEFLTLNLKGFLFMEPLLYRYSESFGHRIHLFIYYVVLIFSLCLVTFVTVKKRLVILLVRLKKSLFSLHNASFHQCLLRVFVVFVEFTSKQAFIDSFEWQSCISERQKEKNRNYYDDMDREGILPVLICEKASRASPKYEEEHRFLY